jgi:hypothetical protein
MFCGNGTLASSVARKVSGPPISRFRSKKKEALKTHLSPTGIEAGVTV